MQRHQFEAYLEKVFGFSQLVAPLSDSRQFPRHSCQKVFAAVLFAGALQHTSLHQLERECREGVLKRRIGAISEDTFRYVLQRLDRVGVCRLWCAVARRLKRNGLLRTAQTRGLVVAAVDGIEICHSRVRCCEACLERTVRVKVGAEERDVIEYYHRLVAVAIVSTPFPIPLGIRFQAKGEGEAACALALLRELTTHLGRRFIDVLVGDALYLAAPYVEEFDGLGLAWVLTLKDNQPDLLDDVERATNGLPTDQRVGPEGGHWTLWHVPAVYWARADRSVRVVKTICKQPTVRLKVHSAAGQRKTWVKETVWERRTNIYATTVELVNIPPAFIEQLGRSRWRIDTEVFQTLTTHCALKRPSVHQNHDRALEVLTMIRVLAYTLAQVFFHRQVLSHCRRHQPSFCDLASTLWFAPGLHDTS